MQSLFRRTRTRVHTPAAEQAQRHRGEAAAARTAAALQLGAQLILWIFFTGYDRAAQAVWQSALMLFVPLGVLWLLWRNADTQSPAARRWMLLLIPCLWADAVFLLCALGGFMRQLVPFYPSWVVTLLPAAVCALSALRAKARGVWYGSAVLSAPLVLLAVIGTVFLRASTRADRLWPIWGDGLFATARTALTGAGAVWGAALVLAVPHSKKQKSAGWLLAPFGLCVLCALWFGFLNPWSPGDTLPIAEKMMGLARHAHSVILYEMSGILWMLLIPASLTACFSAGGGLLQSAFPRVKDWLSLLVIPIPAIAAALIWPDVLLGVLPLVLPWRYVPALACGVILLIGKRRAT